MCAVHRSLIRHFYSFQCGVKWSACHFPSSQRPLSPFCVIGKYFHLQGQLYLTVIMMNGSRATVLILSACMTGLDYVLVILPSHCSFNLKCWCIHLTVPTCELEETWQIHAPFCLNKILRHVHIVQFLQPSKTKRVVLLFCTNTLQYETVFCATVPLRLQCEAKWLLYMRHIIKFLNAHWWT